MLLTGSATNFQIHLIYDLRLRFLFCREKSCVSSKIVNLKIKTPFKKYIRQKRQNSDF